MPEARGPGGLQPRLAGWLVWGEWRAHPLRIAAATIAIALGVALGFAVDLINSTALDEFSAAAASLSGRSDLQVRGPHGAFDEAVYPFIATHAGVAVASPVLELDVSVPGRRGALKVIGIDVFRAATVTPGLPGVPAPERSMDTLAGDAIFLSPAAREWLAPAGSVVLQSGTGTVAFRVAGGLVSARPGQRVAVMDIAAVQWRFARLGKLSRIDLKLAPGVSRAAFRITLARELALKGDALQVTESADREARSDNMSRAYRVNLNVLALVALFTGAFLIFSTQALSVMRRRSQFALLRVMGLTRVALLRQILLEGGVLGLVGALLGLAGGYAIAAAALAFFGSDLGGGYFSGLSATVRFSPGAALVFMMLGVGVAVLGSLAPALEAVHADPAPALKSGAGADTATRFFPAWPALACMLLAGLLTLLPPVLGLPLFGYAAIALLLIGAIALLPRCAGAVFRWLSRRFASYGGHRGGTPSVVATLALSRLANMPGPASVALGGVLSSVSLMVAMAIMVSSFRVSVDDWLGQVLGADLYVRAASGGETGAIGLREQQAIGHLPGVRHAAFSRLTALTLDPARPAVALIARDFDGAAADAMPLVATAIDAPVPSASAGRDAAPVSIWVSEAMLDLYHYRPGQLVTLPISQPVVAYRIAGVWRDYARQAGAIRMRLSDYRRLTGDGEISDAALTLRPGASAEQVTAAIRGLPFGDLLDVSQPGQIRALSLTIFDRSFAVTYLLELVAIAIGLSGVAAGFSAQTLARLREFGMLRHIGATRRQIMAILMAEGALLTGFGILLGCLVGWAIGLILIFVVNPQSFHWRMQLHAPWGLLLAITAAMLASAVVTTLAAGWQAVAGNPVQAIREDD